MTMSSNVPMQQKRGPFATMPTVALDGELLIPSDRNEIWVGTGTGRRQLGIGTDHVTKYSIFDDVQAVYADGMPGTVDPRGREGWYFTNPVLGQKINWYYYNPTIFSTTVANFQNAYAIVTLDTTKYPYFGIYTQPTGTGDAPAGWYKSKRVYSATTTAVTPGKYLIHFGTNPDVYPELPRIALTVTNNQSVGAFASTEIIYLLALNTNSAQPINDYKFVTHQLGFQTTAAKQEFDLRIRSGATTTFTQTTASTTWNIPHRLGKRPSITTVDTAGNVIQGQVVYNSDIQATVYFGLAVAGSAYLN